MEPITISIKGLIPSKKNKVRHKKGGGGYYDDATRREIDWLVMNFRMYANSHNRKELAGNLNIYTELTTPRRQDSDNMHTTILDCLQSAGIIVNDKDVCEGSYKRIIDKAVDNAGVKVVISFI